MEGTDKKSEKVASEFLEISTEGEELKVDRM
jgi:hypothetical protein